MAFNVFSVDRDLLFDDVSGVFKVGDNALVYATTADQTVALPTVMPDGSPLESGVSVEFGFFTENAFKVSVTSPDHDIWGKDGTAVANGAGDPAIADLEATDLRARLSFLGGIWRLWPAGSSGGGSISQADLDALEAELRGTGADTETLAQLRADIAGGGGGDTLQSATDRGNTTSNALEVTTLQGVILTSADGSRTRVTLDDDESIVTTPI